jgi:hypothetical protein
MFGNTPYKISHSTTEYEFLTSIFQLLHQAAKFRTHSKDAVDDQFSMILWTLFFYSLHMRSAGLISPNEVFIRHGVSDGKEGRVVGYTQRSLDKSRDTELTPT